MATRKKADEFGTFGWTSIRSNSINALSNNWQHENELRKELQGKSISKDTILIAMRKVNFAKYGIAGIHSFFPDVGKCYVGKSGEHASVVIEWDVGSQKQDELLKEVKELKSLVAKLLKEKV